MGSIATRRERVILDVESNVAAVLTKDAAAAALLKRELNSLSGTSVQTSRTLSRDTSISKMGKDSDTAGKQIDRLSGRLALFAQAAAVLGPALAPLGAPLVGVMAGLTAQMGAVAGSVGVAVLAFKGMGDGLKAVNEYQLEPTADNLQAMRIEMEKLGPAGAEFVRFLDSLGPELSSLQMAAREGLLPGATEGLEELMTMLPRVRSIVSDLAEAMGGLAGDAGADLAGPEWERFFRYLDTEAGPLLTEFGQTVGNFANGFANMIVSLSPLTKDFSGGLLAMSESFAQWSSTLDSNQGFQEFLDYVQESGPKAMDFLGSLIDALASIATAMAPVGDVVLPVLTKMLDIIGDLADSPMGTMFFTAAAGLSVYSRAAAIAASATTRLTAANKTTAVGFAAMRGHMGQVAAGAGMVALAYTDLDDKAGLSNTAMLGLAGTMLGPWGAAAGAAVGLTLDLAASNDSLADALGRANNASINGTVRQQEAEYARLAAQIDKVKTARDNIWNPDQSVADGMLAIWSAFSHADEEAANSLAILEANIGNTNFAADQMAGILGVTARQFEVATGNAQAFSGALAQMNGWLDKRAALRAYQEELKNFGKALENGFQPKNLEGLDRVADGILQVASQIKNVEVRKDFMANARKSLLEFAATGPKAKAAVDKVIDQFIKWGLMEPRPKLDVDDKPATAKMKAVQRLMDKFGMTKAEALATLRDRATPDIDAVAAALRLLDGNRATVYIDTIRNTIGTTVGGGNRGDEYFSGAHGGFTGPGGKYEVAGIVHRGEVVIPQERVKADWSMLKARYGDLPGMAAGGFAGGSWQSSSGDNWSGNMSGLATFNDDLRLTGVFLRNELKARLALLTKEQEAGKARLDMLKQEKQALEDSIKARFSADPWGQEQGATGYEGAIQKALDANDIGAANALMAAQAQATAPNINSFAATLQQQIADAEEFDQLRKQLVKKGFNGPALNSFLMSATIEEIRAMAAGTRGQINKIENLYEQRGQTVQQSASSAGNAGWGGAIKAWTAKQEQTNAELRLVRQELEQIKKSSKDAPKEIGQEVGAAVNGAASNGHRNRRR